jgi:acyl-coenzyme A synthetase/AMP-(fatty) acid ligase
VNSSGCTNPMQNNCASLWGRLSVAGDLSHRLVSSCDASVTLADLITGSSLGGRLEELRGRSVFVRTKDQFTAAIALIELDGIARRLVLCPPDLPDEHVPVAIAIAEADAMVCDGGVPESGVSGVSCVVRCSPEIIPGHFERNRSHETEWILFTSGTTGLPKLVLHTLSSLCPTIGLTGNSGSSVVWSTFYDIRRYGGLQIFLRGLLGGSSLVLSSAEESTEDFLVRAGGSGVTHISGTPSHWRRALMSASFHRLAPGYIRLSGEMADQAILDNLHTAYPHATIVHAFASTEAGLAFEVRDGLAGFPASLIGLQDSGVEMKIEDGSLRIRSPRTAARYLGSSGEALTDQDGFVDTHDLVELRGERYYFVGRADGVINVGGLKVHPEEVEAVISRHPGVRMSLVKARRNPITGALVVADVVAQSTSGQIGIMPDTTALKAQILETCRQTLPAHKVPAAIRFVPSLEMTTSGKLARR